LGVEAMLQTRIRRFVKKHERAFVIAGTLLAACSVLLKEVVREDIKDFRDSLGAAKTAFVISKGFLTIHEQIGLSLRETSGTAADETKQSRIITLIEAFEAEVDNMGKIFKVMEQNPDDEQMFKSTKKISKMIGDELGQIRQLQDSPAKTDKLTELEKFAGSWAQRTFNWQERILREAEEQESEREKTYKRVSYLLYAFVILGAITGLLGKILNVKALSNPG
jgi:hypothetical protein